MFLTYTTQIGHQEFVMPNSGWRVRIEYYLVVEVHIFHMFLPPVVTSVTAVATSATVRR